MSVTEQDVRAAAPANAPEDVVKWVAEIAELTTPDAVEFCDGSQEEWDRLTAQMVESGMFTKLNEEKRPNSFLARSKPSDVARVESRTFICCEKEEDAGPTNHWADPKEHKPTVPPSRVRGGHRPSCRRFPARRARPWQYPRHGRQCGWR